jgi:hypothetical protein
MTSWLVTVLGLAPKPARYTLDGRSVEPMLAPLTLMHLLPPDRRPSRIIALCTAEAKEESWPILLEGRRAGIEAALVEIGADAADVTSFLRIAATATPIENAPHALVIDATQGYRHFAVLTYFTLQYLSALRRIELRNAFYGLWRPIEEGPSAFLDLRALLMLPDWIHALRVFGDAGDASGLGRLFKSDGDQVSRAMARELRQISDAVAATCHPGLWRNGQRRDQVGTTKLKARARLVEAARNEG